MAHIGLLFQVFYCIDIVQSSWQLCFLMITFQFKKFQPINRAHMSMKVEKLSEQAITVHVHEFFLETDNRQVMYDYFLTF